MGFKNDIEMEYGAQLLRLRTEGRIVLQRVMNTVEEEHKKLFQAAVAQGGLPELEITGTTLKDLMLASAQKVLAPPAEG